MEATLFDKQKLLREEILESGVDADGFMEFMSKYKGQKTDMDLDTWTMQELQQVVNKFKLISQQKVQEQQIEVPTSFNKQMTMSIIKQHSQLKTKKLRYHRDQLWDYEIIAEQKCQQLQRKISASKKKLSVQCKKYNIKNVRGYLFGLIGSKNQLWIQIFTNFTTNSIERKSDDFDWLHDMLLKRFVGAYVPPLQRMITFIPEDKSGIQKRINAIMNFVRYLTGCQNIINSNLMWNFLNLHQYGQFENWKKKQSEKNAEKDLQKIATVDGTFKAQISQRIQKIINYSGELSVFNGQCFTSLESNLTKVLSDLQTLNKHLRYVGGDMEKIAKNYQRFQKKANPKQNNQLFLIYTYLNDLIRTFTEQTTSQINIFKDVLEGFIKSNEQQWTQFNNYHKRLKNQLENYLNEKLNLDKKRQKYFENPGNWQIAQSEISKTNIPKADMSKEQVYSLVFPQENQKQQQKRAFQAFLNSKYQQSLMIFLRNQQNKTIHYFHLYDKYVKKHNEEIANFMQSFKSLVTSTNS